MCFTFVCCVTGILTSFAGAFANIYRVDSMIIYTILCFLSFSACCVYESIYTTDIQTNEAKLTSWPYILGWFAVASYLGALINIIIVFILRKMKGYDLDFGL